MHRFVINTNPQVNGDHEVHNMTLGCNYLPHVNNQRDLGYHVTCQQAVAYAKQQWPQNKINGCYYCANACHTT